MSTSAQPSRASHATSPPRRPQPLPDEGLERQAVAWLVRLQSQPTSTRLTQACDRWRASDPHHEQAWQAVQLSYGLLRQNIQRLPPGDPAAAIHALERSAKTSGRRKTLGRLAALLLIAPPVGWMAERHLPWQRLGADYTTATGERRDFTLPDGTRLALNTDSAVRVRFDEQQRLLLLDRGEIFVVSGADASSPIQRALRVQTAQGRLEALGTRFSVRLLPTDHPPASRLSVEQGAVRLQPGWPAANVQAIAEAGTSWLMTSSSAQADHTSAHTLDPYGWTEGLLVVQDMRLADFLAEVDRYRRGHLSWADDAASLRISGTYPVADTTQLLALLERVLPIEVVSRTPFWTYVRRADRTAPVRVST